MDIVCVKCGHPKHCSSFRIIEGRYFDICVDCCKAWVLAGHTPFSPLRSRV